mgnify:CR=1 FL=1
MFWSRLLYSHYGYGSYYRLDNLDYLLFNLDCLIYNNCSWGKAAPMTMYKPRSRVRSLLVHCKVSHRSPLCYVKPRSSKSIFSIVFRCCSCAHARQYACWFLTPFMGLPKIVGIRPGSKSGRCLRFA